MAISEEQSSPCAEYFWLHGHVHCFWFQQQQQEQSLPLQPQQSQPQPQQIVTNQTQEFASSPSKISFLVANPSDPAGSAVGGTQLVAEVPQSVVGEFSRQEIQTAATQIVTSLLHRVTDQDEQQQEQQQQRQQQQQQQQSPVTIYNLQTFNPQEMTWFVKGPFTLNVSDRFGVSASALVSYWNPFLGWLAWFIMKSKQFIQSNSASDIAALKLTLSVNGPLRLFMFRRKRAEGENVNRLVLIHSVRTLLVATII